MIMNEYCYRCSGMITFASGRWEVLDIMGYLRYIPRKSTVVRIESQQQARQLSGVDTPVTLLKDDTTDDIVYTLGFFRFPMKLY